MMISPEAPWILTMPRAQPHLWLRCKRAFDLLAAGSLLVVSAPVLLLALATVKLTSSGPAIYSQRRIGKHNRNFTIYKVRSMRVDAERIGGPRWCVPGDPRITGVGRWLRKLHIDELPQLWNVLRGEMSLVGPRPERPEFMPKIRPFVPDYDARHAVLPGITGLAQVQVDADTDVDNVARKLKYDLYYIRHQGPILEAKIFGYTLLKVFGATLPTLRRMMALGLDDETTVPQRRAA
jgi:lipopolysaccharide/colanic/teichoic acid biosynthesis glycosyltransferase